MSALLSFFLRADTAAERCIMSELHILPWGFPRRGPGGTKSGPGSKDLLGSDILNLNSVSASDAESKALKSRALNLSLNYNFVTPLTSMVVTKPEGQEQSQVANKPVEDGKCEARLSTS